MKQWIKAFILTAIVAVIAIGGGCKKSKSGTLQLKVNATYGGGYFAVSEGSIDTFNIDPASRVVQVETLQFFLSHIYLISANGSKVLASTVNYFNLADPSTLTLTVPDVQGDFTGITFNCGIDSLMDSINPVSSSCPLQLATGAADGMYWPMLLYLDESMAGKWDTAWIPLLSHGFVYHIGGNQFYRSTNLNSSFTVGGGQITTKTLTLDIEKIFYSGGAQILNINTQGYSMCTPDSADEIQTGNLFATNFSQAFSLQ